MVCACGFTVACDVDLGGCLPNTMANTKSTQTTPSNPIIAITSSLFINSLSITKWVSYATKPNMNSATAKLIQLTNYTKPNSAESQAYGVDTSHQLESLSIDDCRYIRIVKIVLKMLQNICVVIKTTTSCVCLRAKGGGLGGGPVFWHGMLL